jgi:transcriptional regulator
MSLYTPSHFVAQDGADATALMRDYPFATLITATAAELQITHLPLLWEAGGAHGVLLGHMAKANPHWQAFAEGRTTAIFHGPHAYISPSWYANPEREVPTWNYATVHAQGRPQLIESAAEKLALIDRTTAVFERDNAAPWTRAVTGERLERMLDAIVAMRWPVESLEAKFKMNQNRTSADRLKVVQHLQETGHPELHAMAQWMESHERS